MTEKLYPTPYKDHYPKGLEWGHMVQAQPVYRILNDAVTKYPERVAMDFLGHEMTFAELKEEVNKVAKGLKKLGLGKGMQVGILMPNCPHYVIAYYAILRTGATVVNLSPLCSKQELAAQIKLAEISCVLTLDLTLCYGNIAGLVEQGIVQRVVVGALADYLPTLKGLLFNIFKRKSRVKWPEDDRHIAWETLLLGEDEEFEAQPVTPEEDVAVLQFTGGTTGVPKAAMLTHANVYANVMQACYWCEGIEDGKETMLAVLPFFHVFAMTAVMNMALAKGATLIIHPRFELDKVLKDIQKKRPTLMPGVPTMFNAMLNAKDIKKYDLTSLKLCVSGGAPLPLEVKQAFEAKTGCTLVEGYGLTEAAPVVAFNPPFGKQKPGTIGQPMPQTEVMIEDMEKRGVFLSTGQVGELCVRGPQVMKGYYKNSEETAQVLVNGMLRTGDIARMDEEGYITIVDRLKQMLICGGFNVYPRTIEEVLYTHPAVKEAAVIGMVDSHLGQAAKAVVALHAGMEVNEQELRAYCKEHLAKYEVPKAIEFRAELPKTMIGKVDKKQLS